MQQILHNNTKEIQNKTKRSNTSRIWLLYKQINQVLIKMLKIQTIMTLNKQTTQNNNKLLRSSKSRTRQAWYRMITICRNK